MRTVCLRRKTMFFVLTDYTRMFGQILFIYALEAVKDRRINESLPSAYSERIGELIAFMLDVASDSPSIAHHIALLSAISTELGDQL